jgi:hypothetical protein
VLGYGQESFEKVYDANTYTQVTHDIPAAQQDFYPHPAYVCQWNYALGVYAADYVEGDTWKYSGMAWGGTKAEKLASAHSVLSLMQAERASWYPTFEGGLLPATVHPETIAPMRAADPLYQTRLTNRSMADGPLAFHTQVTKQLVPASKYYTMNGFYSLPLEHRPLTADLRSTFHTYKDVMAVMGMARAWLIQEDAATDCGAEGMCGDRSFMWVEEWESKEVYEARNKYLWQQSYWSLYHSLDDIDVSTLTAGGSSLAALDTDGVDPLPATRPFNLAFKAMWDALLTVPLADGADMFEGPGTYGTCLYNQQLPSHSPCGAVTVKLDHSLTAGGITLSHSCGGKSGYLGFEGPLSSMDATFAGTIELV